jgi:hypothetical protein
MLPAAVLGDRRPAFGRTVPRFAGEVGAVEFDRDALPEHRDRHDQSELRLFAEDDSAMAAERAFCHPDRVTRYQGTIGNEIRSGLLQSPDLPELVAEERLVSNLQKAQDDVAPENVGALGGGRAQEHVAGEEREIRPEGPAGASNPMLSLGQIEGNPERLEVAGEDLFLAAASVCNHPGADRLGQVEETLREYLGPPFEQRHSSRPFSR